jgi:hypothetical protein
MAITLVVFAAVQLLIPTVVRQSLMSPVTTTVAVDNAVLNSRVGLHLKEDDTFEIQGYTAGGSWALKYSSPLLKADGSPYVGEDARPCLIPNDKQAADACTIAKNLHFEYTYQPASRYWTFQWIELSMFIGLSLLLTGFGFFWLRRRV